MAILLLVAIVFIYISSVQFPVDQPGAWRAVRGVCISLMIMLASSGMAWQTGLFQYGLLQAVALAGAFGSVLPRQKPYVIGWLFGLPALGWSIVAAWVSYQLYVDSFFLTLSWLEWALWPVWLLAVIPVLKTRYQFISRFFGDYAKQHPQ